MFPVDSHDALDTTPETPPLRKLPTILKLPGLLDPMDRLSEALTGLIMVLAFTNSMKLSGGGERAVDSMLKAALGCNLAWGMLDGVLYVMGQMADRSSHHRLLQDVHAAPSSAAADRAIRDAVPDVIAGALVPQQLDAIRARLLAQPLPPPRTLPTVQDLAGGVGIVLLILLAGLPVLLPFVFLHETRAALHLSNRLAMAVLFVGGVVFGRRTERNPLAMGLVMVAMSIVLIKLTDALGAG
jgi:hypothetical protein